MSAIATKLGALIILAGVLAACSSHSEDPLPSSTPVPATAPTKLGPTPAVAPSPAQSQAAQPQSELSSAVPVPVPVPTPTVVASAKRYKVAEAFAVGKDVYVRSLAVDPGRNSLWVGTSVGVLEVDLATRDMKSAYTRKDGLANEYVFAITVDKKGRAWFGTNGGGMSSFDNGAWRTYFPMHGLADYWVYSFGEQADGSLWVGTWAGVNRFDTGTGQFTTYVKELVNEWVYGIGVDKRQRVWFGTEGGVSMYDGQQWRAWTHADGLGAPNSGNLPISTNTGLGTRSRHDLSVLNEGRDTYNPNYVFCVYVDAEDAVWAGTWGGGVSRFDGNAWRNLTSADGLAGNIVFSMAGEPGGAMWFGTDKGVSRYDGKAWQSYGRADGLMGEHVYAVAVTASGDVWLGTRTGVARLAKE